MSSRAHLSSATDQWPTPQGFFDRLHAEFGFVLDVCADALNAKAPAYYALDHADPNRRDGLAQDWAAEADRLRGAVWMNSPYGRPIAAWMAKARETAAAGATVVALVPVRADTAWWHEHVLGSGAQVRYVRGRLTFGDATNTAAFASAVVIYRPTDVPGQPGPVGTMPAKSPNVRPAKTPDALIDNYWGAALPPEQFALAEPVVKDTARIMAPTTTGQANVYLSSLTAFLAGPCGWDRTSAPDLRTLLSSKSVVVVTEAMRVSDRTKVHRREVLHRICRQLGTMPASARNDTLGYAQHPDRFIVAGITQPLPVAALVQAHRVRHGSQLTDKGLTLALNAVRIEMSTGTATGRDAVTMPRLATIRALAEATSPEVVGIPSSTNRSTVRTATPTTAKHTTSKPMTRAQRIAFAKKSHALAQSVAAAHAPTLELGPVDTTSLDAATIATCTTFRPMNACPRRGVGRQPAARATAPARHAAAVGARAPAATAAESLGSWPGSPTGPAGPAPPPGQ